LALGLIKHKLAMADKKNDEGAKSSAAPRNAGQSGQRGVRTSGSVEGGRSTGTTRPAPSVPGADAAWHAAAAARPLRERIARILEEASGELASSYGPRKHAGALRSDHSGRVWFSHTDLEPRFTAVDADIATLRRKLDDQSKALLTEQASAKHREKQIKELEAGIKELNEKERLAHLLSRVGEPARKRLLDSPEFRSEFSEETPRSAYVLSIDIRRSTELMLKAREPKLYAQFIITLATRLREIILANFGIFDKFTGDGVLAFFPEFYSGEDAGYLAIKSASECHEVFASVYKEHRRCFAAVLKDTGLGIGLDYGTVQLVQIGGDFTVVGTPVVYACRMSGATAGSTYANEPAFELLFHEFSEYCDFEETEIDIKHEGKTLAHRARLNGKPYDFRLPEWTAMDNESPSIVEEGGGTLRA
jgi:class 3 adenylate cyclase